MRLSVCLHICFVFVCLHICFVLVCLRVFVSAVCVCLHACVSVCVCCACLRLSIFLFVCVSVCRGMCVCLDGCMCTCVCIVCVCVCVCVCHKFGLHWNLQTVMSKVSLIHQEIQHLLMKQQLTLKNVNKLRISAGVCAPNMCLVCVCVRPAHVFSVFVSVLVCVHLCV